MTNEEAIKGLKKLKSFHNGSYGEHIDMAIKAINECETMKKKLHISTQSILDSVCTRVIPAELQGIAFDAMKDKFEREWCGEEQEGMR